MFKNCCLYAYGLFANLAFRVYALITQERGEDGGLSFALLDFRYPNRLSFCSFWQQGLMTALFKNLIPLHVLLCPVLRPQWFRF